MNKEDALKEIGLANSEDRIADLTGANLTDADLRQADLRRADLRGADLRGADLRGADLRWANLRWANLREANLRWANLREANLTGANLTGASIPTYQKWAVSWTTNGNISIGCETKTIAEWDEWLASGLDDMETKRNTADFERLEAAYQHAKRMYEICEKYEDVC